MFQAYNTFETAEFLLLLFFFFLTPSFKPMGNMMVLFITSSEVERAILWLRFYFVEFNGVHDATKNGTRILGGEKKLKRNTFLGVKS